MKILKKKFRKNGLDYTLLKPTDKIALFQLGHLPDLDGYEVCKRTENIMQHDSTKHHISGLFGLVSGMRLFAL